MSNYLAESYDKALAEIELLRTELDSLKAQEPITAVQDDYNADGKSQRIYDYLPAGTPLYAAPTSPSVPAGYVLVPIKPTSAMVDIIEASHLFNVTGSAVYDQILTAAPQPKRL